MVMLQSPNKSSDNNSPSLNGSQMSPNSNPDSPKSNTSPDVNKSNASENNSSTTDIHSPTAKIPKFIITPQNQNLANNNSNNNNIALKSNEEGLRYSMERLKQLTEQHQQRLSPGAEEMENETQKSNNRRSQSPSLAQQQQQQRKLMDLPAVRHLARPEPLQHPHAALLQQHPHLLQNPQFLAAAAQAQQQHHHQQQQQQQNLHHHHHQHPAFHQHLPTAAAAAAAFHLRGPLTNTNTTTLTLPSPANSPLSPPTSPNHTGHEQQQQPQIPATHSETLNQQTHLLTASSTNPSIQLSTNSLQPSSSSTTTPTALTLLNPHATAVAPTHQLINGQITIPPPLTAATHLTLSPSSSSTTISSTSSSQQEMDLEKLKLVAQAQAVVARSSAVAGVTLNGQAPPRPDLSDYGFRIQLGGLAAAAAAAAATSRQIAAANYARSDTSEELNVDGNDDEESNDGSQGTPSVSWNFI